MGNQVATARRRILQIKNKAFSLLEVSVVIFLLALFFSLSIPLFSAANSNRLKDLSAKFINLVNYTRDQASITNTTHFLYLDSQTNRIFVYQKESELDSLLASELAKTEQPFQKDKIFVSQVSSKLSISQITYEEQTIPAISLQFDPSGFSELFQITFTDGEHSIHYTQNSVLGSFYVHATK